jgi:hypothetical protein
MSKGCDAAHGRMSHPEILPGEVLIGNMFRSDFKFVGWKTKRRGVTAYLTNGKPIPKTQGFCPVFVTRAEIEAAGVAIPATGPVDHRWIVKEPA